MIKKFTLTTAKYIVYKNLNGALYSKNDLPCKFNKNYCTIFPYNNGWCNKNIYHRPNDLPVNIFFNNHIYPNDLAYKKYGIQFRYNGYVRTYDIFMDSYNKNLFCNGVCLKLLKKSLDNDTYDNDI